MFDDPIVAETHRIRDAFAASFNYDLARIVRDLQTRQGADGRTLVSRLPKTIVEMSEPRNVLNPPIARLQDGSSPAAVG